MSRPYRTVMALIRGLKGLFPCPICLVPRDEQSNLSIARTFELRTQTGSQNLVERALSSATLAEAEIILKEQSLRPVQVLLHSQRQSH